MSSCAQQEDLVGGMIEEVCPLPAPQEFFGVGDASECRGVAGKLLDAPHHGCNVAGLVIVCLMAEISKQGTGGMQGCYRRRLLEA